jgi:hypothetical protein
MIKRREPSKLASMKQVDAFAAGADGGQLEDANDPNAKHNFKSINLPMNEYEYRKLEIIASKTGRTKLSAIRWAIAKAADELEGNQ